MQSILHLVQYLSIKMILLNCLMKNWLTEHAWHFYNDLQLCDSFYGITVWTPSSSWSTFTTASHWWSSTLFTMRFMINFESIALSKLKTNYIFPITESRRFFSASHEVFYVFHRDRFPTLRFWTFHNDQHEILYLLVVISGLANDPLQSCVHSFGKFSIVDQ